VKVRFLIANAYRAAGTVRTTYNVAGALAQQHGFEVEIVSVFRTRPRPAFVLPEGVRLTSLVDSRPRHVEALQTGDGGPEAGQRMERWLRTQPSRLINRNDWRYSEFNLYSDAQLTRYLRSVRDGVLIGTRPGLNLAMARLAHPSVVRIGQEHVNLASHHDRLLKAFRRSYPRLDLCTTLTEEDRATFEELLGPKVKVRCIPNGIFHVPRGWPDQQSKVVIAAGRYEYQKGFSLLIRAWRQVAEKHPDWQLRIFGHGNRGTQLQEVIDNHRLGDHVRLMGYTTQLDRELAASAFFVLSSRYEGFPMVLLEAMAAGLSAVSYDCLTGPRDLIDHGRNGLLVPNGNVSALGSAINTMIERGPEQRDAMGRAALETTRGYNVDVLAARWRDVIETLAAERGHAKVGSVSL
jgi:glycosyltransferase involved in cell wall biosynthesis